MAGWNYTSVNVTKEQHEKLKRIADFKKAKITDVSVEMATEYIERFMDKHGEVMAEMEELENHMTQLRSQFRESKNAGVKHHINKSLRAILKPAYDPCQGFSGACASMRWAPELGHVPRGFYGALGDVSEVRLVMVLAEPSDPGRDEIHSGVDSAFSYAERCYLGDGGQGHANTMSIIGRCFPGLPPQEAMRKVWITESVLCSAKTPGAKVGRTCEQLCVSTYLDPQLRLFPNAIVAAMGSKAYKRLKKYIPNIVECGAVFPPGCNFPSTKAKWDRLVSIVRSTTEEMKGEGQRSRLHGETASERASMPVAEAMVADHRLEGVELAGHLARTFASQLPEISEVGQPAAKNPVRWYVRHPALTRLHGAKANIIALWVNKSEVQILVPYIKIPGVTTVPDRLGTPKLRVRLDDYTEHELTEHFKDLGRRSAGVLGTLK